MTRTRIVVLISGSGTNLQALLDAERLGAQVVKVVSDRPDAFGLQRAEDAGISTVVVDPVSYKDRPSWEVALIDTVDTAEPELVVLAGFMRILSSAFVTKWPVINVHPSLLPAFPGAHAVRDAVQWGVKIAGVTVHLVDEHVDHGPIIAQQAVQVDPRDTEATLHERLHHVEHQLLPDVVRAWCSGHITVDGRTVTSTVDLPGQRSKGQQ